MSLFFQISAGCLLLVITMVSAHPANQDHEPDDKEDGQNLAKKSFAQLLDNIAKVNKDRVEALKSLSRLQGLTVDGRPPRSLHRALRSSDDDGDGDRSGGEDVLAVVVMEDDDPSVYNYVPTFRSNSNQVDQYEYINIEPYKSLNQTVPAARTNKRKPPSNKKLSKSDKKDLVSEKELQALRAKWRRSCDKSAAKNCYKACKAAYKNACDEYECRSRLKRSFKKNCKTSCYERFEVGDSDYK